MERNEAHLKALLSSDVRFPLQKVRFEVRRPGDKRSEVALERRLIGASRIIAFCRGYDWK